MNNGIHQQLCAINAVPVRHRPFWSWPLVLFWTAVSLGVVPPMVNSVLLDAALTNIDCEWTDPLCPGIVFRLKLTHYPILNGQQTMTEFVFSAINADGLVESTSGSRPQGSVESLTVKTPHLCPPHKFGVVIAEATPPLTWSQITDCSQLIFAVIV